VQVRGRPTPDNSVSRCDVDELQALAGRVASDLSEIIKRHPVELAALLRTTNGLSSDAIVSLDRAAQKAKSR